MNPSERILVNIFFSGDFLLKKRNIESRITVNRKNKKKILCNPIP